MRTTENAPVDSLLTAIGDHLAEKAKQMGLKKKQLSELTELNRNTVSAALAGKDVRLSTLLRLSRVLGETQWLTALLAPVTPPPMQQLKASKTRRRVSGPAPRRMGQRYNKDNEGG